MQKRPFYIIAHNPNTVEEAITSLQLGANALEPDIRYDKVTDNYYVNHGAVNGAMDITLEILAPTLKDYLSELKVAITQNSMLNLALIAFDCKDTNHDINQLLSCIRQNLTDDFPQINVLITISDFVDRAFFQHANLRLNEAVGIDEDNSPNRVEDFFKEISIQNYGYANGITKTLITRGPNVFHTVSQAVAMEAKGNSYKFVHTWIIDKPNEMRDYLNMGVDGIITSKVETLNKIINEEFNAKIYLPTAEINPFENSSPKYTLTVKTGDIKKAGTDAQLSFCLKGQNGQLESIVNSNPKQMFERNNTNFVVLQGKELGEVQTIQVKRTDKKNAPNWFLENIQIESPLLETPKTFQFKCWIGTDWVEAVNE